MWCVVWGPISMRGPHGTRASVGAVGTLSIGVRCVVPNQGWVVWSGGWSLPLLCRLLVRRQLSCGGF